MEMSNKHNGPSDVMGFGLFWTTFS